MRWFTPLLVLTSVALAVPSYSQLTPGGPSGDFRVNDRPGTAPTVGPPGGPSLPPDSTLFRETFGSKAPDEILKNIDKDLGRSPSERPSPSFPLPDPAKDSRPSLDRFK